MAKFPGTNKEFKIGKHKNHRNSGAPRNTGRNRVTNTSLNNKSVRQTNRGKLQSRYNMPKGGNGNRNQQGAQVAPGNGVMPTPITPVPGGPGVQPHSWDWASAGGLGTVAGVSFSSNYQWCDCKCRCDVPIEAIVMPDGNLCPSSAPYGGSTFIQEPHPIGTWGGAGNVDNCDFYNYYDLDGDGWGNDYEGILCHYDQLPGHGNNIDYRDVETFLHCQQLCDYHCASGIECGQLHGHCGGLR